MKMEHSELKNTKTTWFRRFLFGRKKKNPYMKKNTCSCCEKCQRNKTDKTVQTNIYSDNKEQLKVKAFENPNEMQKSGECPGIIYPMERRGCGFHLYFCIDNVRKSDFAKRKKTKKVNYEGNKYEELFEKLDKSKETLPSDMTGRLAETEQTNPRCPCFQSTWSEVKNKSNLNVKYIPPGINEESLPGNIVNKTKQSSSNLSNEKETKANSEIEKKTLSKVRISSVETPIYPEINSIKPVHEEKSQPDILKTYQGSDQWEEEIFKEYEVIKRPTLKRNTEITRSTFVRNSLINLRKEKYSATTDMVNEVLLKLGQIEERITELEAIGGKKGKTITNIVGISCKNAKSALSIDIKNQNSIDEQEKKTSPEIRSKSDMTVYIK